jgi:hypothetical protein
MSLPYTTPQEFVSHYLKLLQQDLGTYNIQVSKVGFVGYLLNILGYTNFDIKNYYDSLFIDAFVATAQDDESLFIHSSIYGYYPTYATPATATGTLNFDISNALPQKQATTRKREILIGYYIDKNKGAISYTPSFNINGYAFDINTTFYKFVAEYDSADNAKYYAEVLTNGGITIIPSPTSNISVPLFSTIQEQLQQTIFTIPNYSFGSFYTYSFTINVGQFLSGLDVSISTDGKTWTPYEVKYVKYLESGSSKCVFLRKITSQQFMLEFGSGNNGQWVANTQVKLSIHYSQGSAGNLINKTNTQSLLLTDYTVLYTDYNSDLESSQMSSVLQNPIVLLDYSSGGKDPLSGENLRDEIIRFIQTRNNLISEIDFYNIATTFLTDFKFLFKKVQVVDNTFYLCRSFRDKMQELCLTTTLTQEIMNIDSIMRSDTLSINLTNVGLQPNSFYYYMLACKNENGSIVQSHIIECNPGSNLAIATFWLSVDNIYSYRLYSGTTEDNLTQYWDFRYPDTCYVDSGVSGSNNEDEIIYVNASTTLDDIDGTISTGEYEYIIVAKNEENEDIRVVLTTVTIGTDENKSITLTWNHISGAISYILYRNSAATIMYWIVPPLGNIVSYKDNGTLGILINSVPYSLPKLHAIPCNVGFNSSETCSYKVVAYDQWGKTKPSDVLTISLNPFCNAITLNWQYIENAVFYRIYGRDFISSTNYFWDVYAPITTFTDINYNLDIDQIKTILPEFIYTPNIEQINYNSGLSTLVYNPTFEINSKVFISPFLFMGNNNLGYFNSYILKESAQLLFNSIIPGMPNDEASVTKTLSSGYIIPNIYLNILYDTTLMITDIQILSYQDISTIEFTIFIPGITATAEIMTVQRENPNIFEFHYSNPNTYGLFLKEITIQCIGVEKKSSWATIVNGKTIYPTFTAITSAHSQLLDISDQLILYKYRDFNKENQIKDYLICIPAISSTLFNTDKNYYIDKIYNFISSAQLTGNRMISDTVHCSFLNTNLISSPDIESIFLQGGNIYSSFNYKRLLNCQSVIDFPPFSNTDGVRYVISINIPQITSTTTIDGTTTDGTTTTTTVIPNLNTPDVFNGRVNQIATYISQTNSWDFYIPQINDVYLNLEENITYTWDGVNWVNMPPIQLPLKLKVDIIIDSSYVHRYAINIAIEIEKIKLMLAQYLQQMKTGTNVKFYNSQVAEIIHINRQYIKSVEVFITDSNILPNELNNGIEIKSDDNAILLSFKNKIDVVKYVPVLIYWDINNILLTTTMI